MVLHSCACVYLWHARNLTTFIADRFASFMFNVIKIENRKKIDVECFMLVC